MLHAGSGFLSSGLLVALSPLSWACPQKRKTDCSSESGEQQQEDQGSLLSGAPRPTPFLLPELPIQKEEQDSSSSKSESEKEEKEEGHQGDSASALRGNPSLSPRSPGHKWKRECSSEAKEEQRGGRWCSDAAPQEGIRLPPRKRWREYLSLMEKEQQEPLRCLRPAPLTHLGDMEMPCGLKRKHLSSVLPVHHEAFTRLLGKETPHSTSPQALRSLSDFLSLPSPVERISLSPELAFYEDSSVILPQGHTGDREAAVLKTDFY